MRVEQGSQFVLGFGLGKEFGFYLKCSRAVGEFEVWDDMI